METWIDPNYVVQQITLVGVIFLISLAILPVILGALLYGLLSFVAWVLKLKRSNDYTDTDL